MKTFKFHSKYVTALLLLLFLQNGIAQTSPRVMLLGDSITQGRDIPDQMPYRVPLWDLLVAANIDVNFVGSRSDFGNGGNPANYPGFDFDHEGHWAKEAGYLDMMLPTWLATYDVDYALIHAGTNDIDRGQTVSSTIVEMTSIIASLRADNPSVVILLAQIIPMQPPFGKDVTPYNQALASLGASLSTNDSPIYMVDQQTGYDPLVLNYDRWHPNQQGGEQIAQNFFDVLAPLLTEVEEPSDPIEIPIPVFALIFTAASLLVIVGYRKRFARD